jgi:hypothetical protein
MMGRDGRIDDVFSQHPEPGNGAFFVGTCQPTIASHVRGQDRGKSAFDVQLEHNPSLSI